MDHPDLSGPNEQGTTVPNQTEEEIQIQQQRRIPPSSILDDDVLCGRKKQAFNHPGNRKFRNIVSQYLVRYTTSPNRLQKTTIVKEIIDIVRSRGGRFLRHEPATADWIVLTDKETKEKVGHSFRDTNKSGKRLAERTTKPSPSIDPITSTGLSNKNELRPNFSIIQPNHDCNLETTTPIDAVQNEHSANPILSIERNELRPNTSISQEKHDNSIEIEASVKMEQNEHTTNPIPSIDRSEGAGPLFMKNAQHNTSISQENKYHDNTIRNRSYASKRQRHSDSSSQSRSSSNQLDMLTSQQSSSPIRLAARSMGQIQPHYSLSRHHQPVNVAFEQYIKQKTQQQLNQVDLHSSHQFTTFTTLRNHSINCTDEHDYEFLELIHDVLGPIDFDGRDPLNDFVLSDEDDDSKKHRQKSLNK